MQFLARKNGLLGVLVTLLVLNALVWQLPGQGSTRELQVAFFDVGQGDAVFIRGPLGGTILIDGGPDAHILEELGKVMAFGEKTIDIVILTNPDRDHYGGLLDVLGRYAVGTVIEPGTRSQNETYKEFERLIQEKRIPQMIARRGMNIPLGSGAHLDIIFPDRDVSNFSRNDGSVIAKLQYGATSVMLTGDTTKIIEEYLVNRYLDDLPSGILKVAHHGSRSSSGRRFVEAVAPRYAVISDGLTNTYGHPHDETLQTLGNSGVEVLRTDTLGTIIFHSDGKEFVLR